MDISAEEKVTIEPGVWILTEGLPNYFYYYKLLNGKVSVYINEKKINEINVEAGGKPVILGIFAALKKDRKPIASVKTDTSIEAVRIHIDQTLGILSNEVPKNLKDDVTVMIETILLKNEITSMEQKVSGLRRIDLQAPDGLRPDVQEILTEIKRLYGSV